MRKSIIVLLICLTTLLVCNVPSFAASASGSCGKNVTWDFNQSTGMLTIKGSGAMDNFTTDYMKTRPYSFYSTAPWWKYRQKIKKVVIEEGVTHVGYNAFCGDDIMGGELYYDNLTEAVFADSVASIGDYAFWACNLKKVHFGTGLRTIGDQAFVCNQDLKNVVLPEGLAYVGDGAFTFTGMTEVTIPISVTHIGNGAFGCNYGAEGGAAVSMNFVINGYEGTEAEVYYKKLLQSYEEEKSWLGGADSYYSNNYAPGGTIYFNAIKPVNVNVGDESVDWTDATPFINSSGRTMVPLRAVGDALGLTVSWDNSAREAVFTDGSKTIFFPIGSRTARTSEGSYVTMDTSAVIVSSRTYAPVRYLAEYFGYSVGWDNSSKTVMIGGKSESSETANGNADKTDIAA